MMAREGLAGTPGRGGDLAAQNARRTGRSMRPRFSGSSSLRLARWFVPGGCGHFAAASGGPTGLIDLTAAGNRQRIGRNIVGNSGASRNVSAVAYFHRRHECGIAAHEYAAADDGGVLMDPIVIAGDGAGAHVGVAAHARIAEISKVHGFGALTDNAFLDLNKIADASALEQADVATEMGEGPDLSFGRDKARVRH